MKKWFVSFLFAIFGCILGSAQGYYTKYYNDKKLIKKAEKWVKSQQWRNGFTMAKPHKSVNTVEFYLQYQKNQSQWQALFQWLASTDLLNIPKGKHPIEGTTLVASVEDSSNEPLEKRKTESHIKQIDFQYVVRGVERFGLLDHATSKPNTTYKRDVIRYDYEVDKTKFYDSNPGEFFIFFPGDWHIAKVETPLSDQQIRVIVIKVDYIRD